MPILTENKGVGDTGKSEVSFVKCVFLLWKSALVMRCFLFFILSEKVTDRKRTSLLLRRFSWNGWNRKLQVPQGELERRNLRKEKDFAHSLNNFYSKS